MALTLNAFTATKAGMTGVDKEKVKQVIESSTSSNFKNYTSKHSDKIQARINRNNEKLSKLTKEEIEKAEAEMNFEAERIENERDFSRIKVHIDMDAFFASVEMRDNPSLRTIPMAVGDDRMLGTSNYIARKFGVRAAMPGYMAKKLCPELTIVKGSYGKYRKESLVVRKVFIEYDPKLDAVGCDEVYMDITDFMTVRTTPVSHRRRRYRGECVCRIPLIDEDDFLKLEDFTSSEEVCKKCGKIRICIEDAITFGVTVDDVVNEIRFRVEQISGLTCSAGIANNWMLAKICSDINKPNGQYRLENDRETIIEFMRNLPTRKVSGIGPVTEHILKGINVYVCGDLFEKRGIIKHIFSELSWHWFLRVALGKRYRKSIGIERTFKPSKNMPELLDMLHNLCFNLIESLIEYEISGGYVATLIIKFATFERVTRSQSTNYKIDAIDNFHPMMVQMLKKEMNKKKGLKIRLLGTRLSKLKFFEKEKDVIDRKSQKSLHQYLKPKSRTSTSTMCDVDDDTSNQSILSITKIDIETVENYQTIECPICNKKISDENELVNTHVDECLNKTIIEQIEELPTTAGSSTKITKPSEKKKKVEFKKAIYKKKTSLSKVTNIKPLTNYFNFI